MNLEVVERDLRVFADPATPFSIEMIDNSRFLVKMVRDGDRQYRFNLDSGEIVALHDGGRKYKSLAALLASEEFIDIRRFRANQRRILDQLLKDRGGVRPMLAPEGKFVSREGADVPLSRKALDSALGDLQSGKLQILLIDGPAGIGKTSLIESVCFSRSLPDSPLPPLLHVTSGGSRLTDLTKALAHALQVIRASATFDQVPVLVRLGVIQVAIDGFDELVDPDGYKDAWSALREFLGDVGEGGPIVLSGRDTFFDQQEFERLLADRLSNIAVKQARLTPVSPSSAKDYLESSGWTEGDLDKAQSAGWFLPGSYPLRPFFLAQIAGQNGWEELQTAYGSPQSFLVNRMIQREANLVAQAVEISRAAAEDGLWDFFKAIAEDMTIQQSDQVDEDFISFACESAFSGRVERRDIDKLLHRAASFALLESAGGRGIRRFPHSEFQNQFAARALADVARRSALTSPFVRLSNVTSSLAEAFADYFVSIPLDDAEVIYSNLKRMLENEGFSDRGASNLGALLIATLGRGDLEGLKLRSIGIYEARIVGVSRDAVLENVTIGHLYATGADGHAIRLDSDSSVVTLTVDASSIIPSPISLVKQLYVIDSGMTRVVRSQSEISALLIALTANGDDGAGELPFVRYFDRVCRTFIRQRQIRNHEDEAAYRLLQDPYWDVLKGVLGERLVEYTKDTGGPRSIFYRMDHPEYLLVPKAEPDIALRRKIKNKARELID